MTAHGSMETSPKKGSGSTRRKIFAIAAAGAVLGIGATATLAAWTDTEWVFGGDGAGGPGIGTSTFEVQQNTVDPFDDEDDWVSEDANPGGEILFAPDALELTPGDSVYAQFALRTSPESDFDGDVLLQSAVDATGVVANDPGGVLAGSLELRVSTTTDVLDDCDSGAFDPGATIIADGPLATTGGSASQLLDAAAGSVQYYCFEITLPEEADLPLPVDDYMGLTVAPAWEFEGESL